MMRCGTVLARSWRHGAWLVLAGCGWLACAHPAVAADPWLDCGYDQVWEISTRHLGNCPCERCIRCADFQYGRYVPGCGWCGSDGCALAAEPATITVVYVHGNRMRAEDARQQGLLLYRRLRCCCPDAPPVRFVIWSWPSAPIPASFRIFRDVRVKYRRTDTQSYLLARWLADHRCGDQVSLMGYSFGARTILGALHLVGGGQLAGRSLARPAHPCCHFNLVLWAAAAENGWLSPGGCHECASKVVRRGVITVNRRDPVLRRYRRSIIRARQRALGQTGIRGPLACWSDGVQFCELDVTHIVGSHHDWCRYWQSSAIMRQTARVLLFR